MKTTITTLILIFSIGFTQAQSNPATPNAGFENWSHFSAGYDDPDSLTCLNPITTNFGFYTCIKDSTNVHSGKYAARLITMSVGPQLVPGTITTGTINPSNQTISGGLPYTLHPDSITGWYEYTSVSGDNGDVEFYLFGSSNSDTVGEAFFKTPAANVTAYTRISLAVTYRSANPINTALWIMTSSDNQNTGKVGSQLYLDDMGLIFNRPTGIENIANATNIAVGPNPTNGLVSINNSSDSKSILLTVFDITGRKVQEERMTSGVTYINLAGISNGVYLYSIQNEQSAVLKTGKLIIQK